MKYGDKDERHEDRCRKEYQAEKDGSGDPARSADQHQASAC